MRAHDIATPVTDKSVESSRLVNMPLVLGVRDLIEGIKDSCDNISTPEDFNNRGVGHDHGYGIDGCYPKDPRTGPDGLPNELLGKHIPKQLAAMSAGLGGQPVARYVIQGTEAYNPRANSLHWLTFSVVPSPGTLYVAVKVQALFDSDTVWTFTGDVYMQVYNTILDGSDKPPLYAIAKANQPHAELDHTNVAWLECVMNVWPRCRNVLAIDLYCPGLAGAAETQAFLYVDIMKVRVTEILNAGENQSGFMAGIHQVDLHRIGMINVPGVPTPEP